LPLRLSSRLVLPVGIAPFAAAALATGLGFAIIISLASSGPQKLDRTQLEQMLGSARTGDRIEALRYIAEAGAEVADLADYRQMLTSPSIPVRYWLAKALGASRRPEAFPDLLALLDDPHPNVVCMAFFSLGRRGEKKAIAEVLKRIKTSEHWYEQWYGYQTLKALGWRQSEGIKMTTPVGAS
jgi:HEAT repeat protein